MLKRLTIKKRRSTIAFTNAKCGKLLPNKIVERTHKIKTI
jgi:hypothetical protein